MQRKELVTGLSNATLEKDRVGGAEIRARPGFEYMAAIIFLGGLIICSI